MFLLVFTYYSHRIPEAALMARSYLPSKVSEIVALWRKDLNKINLKAAESLADPEEYSNLFEDWQIALSVETKVAEKRTNVNLLESFKNMQLEEEEEASRENGDVDHEVAKENGEEGQEENGENGEEEGQEEAVEVDADSIDGAVLVSGKEAEEEWDPNNDGTLSA
ncbi:hypothetical protein MKW98_003093 [Papaver atlanticum]|uniref:Uncharacterized protein n=1 Tax=Papaver atlanticum TaxID=357466 RepID=A0AAD4THN4_9MAGN|nr:hypothetical protein MKW98_003093 [Papaver atlanticum]